MPRVRLAIHAQLEHCPDAVRLERALELTRVQLDGDRFPASSENIGGKDSLAAEQLDLFPEDGAGSGRQSHAFCHFQ